MGMKKSYRDYKDGVLNDIEASELPHDAVVKSDGFYFKENFWRKLPGLTEMNPAAIGSDPVWALTKFHQVTPKLAQILCASGGSLYVQDDQTKLFNAIHSGMVPNQQVFFLEDNNRLYFGSPEDLLRRYDGGSKTYTVGGENGLAADAPKKFSRIIYNPYAQRYFAIGAKDDPLGLYYSEHIDNGGIESWPFGPQLIESVLGDYPLNADIFEGRITTVSQNSISSGTVVGVPENWVFQKDKAQTGTIAKETFKRYGSGSFFMLTNGGDLYKWPDDKFVNKGRVKFNIDPSYIHLACAEIVDDRYYYLCFKSGEAVSSNKYHLWVYDILGDRFYGPHTQYNIVSMFYDKDSRKLFCGGIDDLAGFAFEHRGRNIKNQIKSCHWKTAYSDYGLPFVEKRYNKGWIKSKQEGALPGGTGQLELIVNTNNLYNNPQSQRIKLEDPANENLSDTNAVKEAITKRFDIYEQYGLGNALQLEVKHNVLNGDFAFSEIDIDYDLKDYEKEDAA